MDEQKLMTDIHEILTQVSQTIKKDLENSDTGDVETKSGRRDLVTGEDKKVEKLIIELIKEKYPDAQFFSEEGYGDKLENLDGLVFFIDPIDGTMNFVKSCDDFASMIGVYLDGEPLVGAIVDVMNDNYYIGGTNVGVYKNKKKLKNLKSSSLDQSLVTISAGLLGTNDHNVQEVARESSGLRIYGSAGIIFTKIIQGKENLYISKLSPWDFAAGRVLVEALGGKLTNIDGEPVDMLKSQIVIVGTESIISEVLNITSKNNDWLWLVDYHSLFFAKKWTNFINGCSKGKQNWN